MKTFQKILLLFIVQLFCLQQNIIAQDTLAVRKHAQDTVDIGKHEKKKFLADPLKATMMAVALPGLGQIYNRKYWKIPVVYAGFGGLIYSAGFNSSKYITYIRAYQDFDDNIPETNSYLALIPADPEVYDPILGSEKYEAAVAQNYKDQMRRMMDSYKRYRDLSYIGIAAWYLVSILDANVDASLFNYDVSNNLDVALAPVQITTPGGYPVAGLNVSLKINF